jgi:hypothetical protein
MAANVSTSQLANQNYYLNNLQGDQNLSGGYNPLGPAYSLLDGPGQMNHFVSQDNLNIF